MRKVWFAGVMAVQVLVAASPVAAAPAAAASSSAAPAIAAVGRTLYLSGIYGSGADPLRQVDEVIERADAALAQRGLGFGSMVQHTIFVRNGAIEPIAVLQRFHATATRLAPSLKERRSVGTIIRVPAMPGDAVVMLDLVAAAPPARGAVDDFRRVPFTFGPAEIAETIGVGDLVYTAGLEAMDFEHGTLAPGIDAQIEAIVGKLDGALRRAGLTVGDMVAHNLYVKQGTDPLHVIDKFHELTRRYAPQIRDRPSVGTLVMVDGMAAEGFLLEMDAVAARPGAAGKGIERLHYAEAAMPIARSVGAAGTVFVSGEVGADPARGGAIPADVAQQVEVAVRNIEATLRKSRSSLGELLRVRLYLKHGAADPGEIRGVLRAALERRAPRLRSRPPAETLLIVEGLAAEQAAIEISVVARRR